MTNIETYWAVTGAIFILGLLLGYIGRTIVADIHSVAGLQLELDKVNAKVDAYTHGSTEAAIVKNVNRNSNL